MARPYILGLGGTTRSGSSTQRALSTALEAARQKGADTLLAVRIPTWICRPIRPAPECLRREPHRILAEIRRADGIILGTPGVSRRNFRPGPKMRLITSRKLKSDPKALPGRTRGWLHCYGPPAAKGRWPL